MIKFFTTTPLRYIFSLPYFLVTIGLIFLNLPVWGQIHSYSDTYRDSIRVGKYQPLSLSGFQFHNDYTDPQISFDTLSKNLEYLFIADSEVALFRNSRPAGKKDLAGVLKESSLVKVIGREYRNIYREPGQEWRLSFEVWNEIRINDTSYFTDYKTHDYLCHWQKLPNLNQTLLVYAQSTGYGYLYDTGYPEYFHILMVNSENQIIYQSSELEFINGDEFWAAELGWLDVIQREDGLWEFIFDGYEKEEDVHIRDKYKAFKYLWNGDTLTGPTID